MALARLLTVKCLDRTNVTVIADLRQLAAPPSGAPYLYIRKAKETYDLIFSWLTWLAVLLVGAYARRDDGDGDDRVARDGGHPNRLTETYSLGL